MKEATKKELKEEIKALNEVLKTALEPITAEVEKIDAEITNCQEVIKVYEDIGFEYRYTFREYERLYKGDEFVKKVKELRQATDEKSDKIYNDYIVADSRKNALLIVKKYYQKIIEKYLNNFNLELLKLIIKYNICNTRDMNIFRSLVGFSGNEDLSFYSYISIKDYSQDIETAIKTGVKLTYCDRFHTATSIYALITDNHGNFKEFTEEVEKEVADYCQKYYKTVTVETDYLKILATVQPLQDLIKAQEEERKQLQEAQKKAFDAMNVYSLEV